MLKIGSRGYRVKEIQKILGVKPDGIFGKITDQYVREFQEDNGLVVDGIVGPLTEAKLKEFGGVEPLPDNGGKFKFSPRSLGRLKGVHPDLVAVVHRALEITENDIMVIDGLRDIERQKIYYAQGKSLTMNSLHLTGHAVDLGAFDDNGKLTWEWPAYEKLARVMRQAAAELGVPIEWGGDWTRLKDGVHFQLPRGYKSPNV